MHGGVQIAFWFVVTPCVYPNYCLVRYRVLKITFFGQLVSKVSLSEIMVQGRSNIGNLVVQYYMTRNDFDNGSYHIIINYYYTIVYKER